MSSQRSAAAACRGRLRIAREESPPPGQILMELVHRVGQCHRQLRQLLNDNIDEAHINDTALIALWLCAESDAPGVPQGELADAAGVSAAQMSGVLERLRRQGWLTSARLQSDRRRQWWRLTAEGRRVQQRILQAVTPAADRLVEKLSPAERMQLRALLDRLASNDEDSARLMAFRSGCQGAQDAQTSQGGGQ